MNPLNNLENVYYELDENDLIELSEKSIQKPNSNHNYYKMELNVEEPCDNLRNDITKIIIKLDNGDDIYASVKLKASDNEIGSTECGILEIPHIIVN